MTQPDDTAVPPGPQPLRPEGPVPPPPPGPPPAAPESSVPPEGSAARQVPPAPSESSAPPVPQAVPPVPEALPGAPELPAPAPVPLAPRPGRVRRAVLRWGAAVLVFGAFGTAAAYAVTQPERSSIPGLKTPDDGRWAYPTPTLPPLPSGSPRPLAEANAAGRHYADLRSLLLPLPKGAVKDGSVGGDSGWVPAKDFAARVSDDPDEFALTLKDAGLRHIAGESWTTPDHVRTYVYLVQFVSEAYAASGTDMTTEQLKKIDSARPDTSVTDPSVPSAVSISAYGQPGDADHGAEAVRYAWIEAGDTVALVMQRGADPEPEVPFRQTVRLQAQLLG